MQGIHNIYKYLKDSSNKISLYAYLSEAWLHGYIWFIYVVDWDNVVSTTTWIYHSRHSSTDQNLSTIADYCMNDLPMFEKY